MIANPIGMMLCYPYGVDKQYNFHLLLRSFMATKKRTSFNVRLLFTDYRSLPLSIPCHELFHAMQGFFDLAVFGGVAHADETISTRTEGIARHNSDLLFTQ